MFRSVEVSFCRVLQMREAALELFSVDFIERGEVGAHVVTADVRGGEAEGGEDAAGARDEDGLHAQLLGEGAGVHPAGPPKGEQGELSRVQSALDANDPERPRHLRVRHAHGAQGDVAEEEVGVGHRGLIAAHIVGGGTRLSTRGTGADAQCTAGVGPGYRAAARADGVDVDHGEFYGDSGDHRLCGRLGFAGQDRGDVRARAAHVEGEGICITAEGTHISRADYASRRAREDTASGVGDGIVHAGYSARGLHYQRRWTPGFFHPLRQPLQVGGEPRGQVGVGGGRGEALVLAELGQDLAAEGDVHVGERFSQRLADLPFVFWMREGEQQAYGYRLYLRFFHSGDGGL